MENEQVVIDTLYSRYAKKGFVTENEILDLCTEYNLPFHRVDYVCDKIISKGVLISDNSPIQTKLDNEAVDYAQGDYESVYRKVLYICPEMKTIINQIRMITPPQKGEIKRLIVQSKSGNNYAREKLIKMHLRMVLKIALQYIDRTTLSVEDLFSVGCLGLIKAVDSYDEHDHSYFGSYSSLWISQHIDRFIMTKGSMISLPVYLNGKYDGIEIYSLDEMLENGEDFDLKSDYDIYEISGKHFLNEMVKNALKTLSEKEEKVLVLRFGLNGGKEFTLEEIGEIFGLTRERIRQLENKALKKMKRSLGVMHIYELY